jgi:hypothetical protein
MDGMSGELKSQQEPVKMAFHVAILLTLVRFSNTFTSAKKRKRSPKQ